MMDVKVAICDDNKQFCDILRRQVESLFIEKGSGRKTDCFVNGEDLCGEMEQTGFDLIFLDIELPQMNGVEVGTYIREHLHNETVQIAYVSSQQKYSMSLFESRPINFLIKPIERTTLSKLIDKFLLITGNGGKTFVLRNNREHIRLPLSDILYFTSLGKKVTAVTRNDKYEFYDTLSNVSKQLDTPYFFFVHKSFIVNYRYIKTYRFTEIILDDNTVIPISRSHRNNVRTIFLDLKNKEME